MTRFDYLRARSRAARRRTVVPLPRRTVAAAFTMVASCGAVFGFEWLRLCDAGARVDALTARVNASDAAARHVRTSESELARARHLLAAIARVRRSAAQRANEVAWIGNRLPRDAWLTSLRYEGGSIALEGGARNVAAVAAAMNALRNAPRQHTARLISVTADATTGRHAVRFAMRLQETER